jgi:hypothetical protein
MIDDAEAKGLITAGVCGVLGKGTACVDSYMFVDWGPPTAQQQQ